MFLIRCILFFIFSAPLYAEIYQCDVEGVAHFSSSPCESQVFNLELGDSSIDENLQQQELFIIASYPGWKNGWEKTKNIKLSRFHEVEYKPLKPDFSVKNMLITQQKLTDLPESMSAERFAISVRDIVDSICKSSIHYPVASKESDNVYYGHYACSYRRDTKKGEIGYYKIMRGENSLYMLAIKWTVKSFAIGNNQFVPFLESDDNLNKISIAQKYLQNDVKLCQSGNCF